MLSDRRGGRHFGGHSFLMLMILNTGNGMILGYTMFVIYLESKYSNLAFFEK
jgi:hypothetical protein